MRTVLDTDVLVAAFRSDRGASRRLVAGALDGKYPLLLSVPLILEYEAVVTRPEHLAVAGITVREARAILDAIVASAQQVRLSFRWRPMLPDPNDDMVLETAVNGSAGLVVTFNQRDFGPAAGQFNFAVVTPGDAVQRLEIL